jgi:hypothetical protein
MLMSRNTLKFLIVTLASEEKPRAAMRGRLSAAWLLQAIQEKE